MLTGVPGRDLGVLMDTDLRSRGVPLADLGVRLPLLLAPKLLTCLKTLQVVNSLPSDVSVKACKSTYLHSNCLLLESVPT